MRYIATMLELLSRKLAKTSESYTLSLLIVSCLASLQFANLFLQCNDVDNIEMRGEVWKKR